MAINKSKKNEIVSTYDVLLDKSKAVFITKYGGLNMPQLDKVRGEIRNAQAEFHITKNTLIKHSLKAKGFDVPEKWLEGSTAMSFCFEDPAAVAKILGTLGKEFEKLSVVGGVMGNEKFDAEGVKALASLPTLDVLRSQLIAAIQGPASNIVGVLNSAVGSIMYALQARIDKEQPAA